MMPVNLLCPRRKSREESLLRFFWSADRTASSS